MKNNLKVAVITVIRTDINKGAVFSNVFINGRMFANGLENEKFLIPRGQYTMVKDVDGTNGLSYELLGVPNRSAIEIHIANYISQLRGCIALGLSRGANQLYESRKALEMLDYLLSDCDVSVCVIIDNIIRK